MKAAVFKRAGSPLVIEDVPDPVPEPNELILKVQACGICGTDLHWSDADAAMTGGRWRVMRPGAVMGHEFAGEIVEVGRAARGRWKQGDRVCAMPQLGCGACLACRSGRPHRCERALMRASPGFTGGYAEFTRIGAAETLALPAGLDFRHGALVEPLAVGLHAVRRAGLQPGERALIVGGGPVGLSVALWCAFLGAREIIVSDLAPDRAERALRFGATGAIDAGREDVAARFRAIAGAPPDLVFDAVGAPGSLQAVIDQAPVDGRVIVVGLCMGADQLFMATAMTKELDIRLSYVYDRADFEMVVEMLGRGRIDVGAMITGCVGFDTFADAFEALKRPGDQVKVLLEPFGPGADTGAERGAALNAPAPHTPPPRS